jgi:hypothetical protein
MRWCHAPYVDMRSSAAVVWVKVSQIAEEGEPIVVKDTCDLELPDWRDRPCHEGKIRVLPLYESARTGEWVWIEIWEPGTRTVLTQPPGGEEVFVVSGSLVENGVAHGTLTWIRNPVDGTGTVWERAAPDGCKLLLKSGHLPMVSWLYARSKDGSRFSSSVLQYRQEERIHGDPHGVDVARREREQRRAR